VRTNAVRARRRGRGGWCLAAAFGCVWAWACCPLRWTRQAVVRRGEAAGHEGDEGPGEVGAVGDEPLLVTDVLRALMIHEIARSTRHRFARTAKPSRSFRRGTALKVRSRKESAQSMRMLREHLGRGADLVSLPPSESWASLRAPHLWHTLRSSRSLLSWVNSNRTLAGPRSVAGGPVSRSSNGPDVRVTGCIGSTSNAAETTSDLCWGSRVRHCCLLLGFRPVPPGRPG